MTIRTDKNNRPTSFEGEDAVDVFRIRTLNSALGLLKAGIKPARHITLTYCLTEATKYTGQKYKRTEVDKAREDLQKIVATRLQHIPIVKEKTHGH